MTDDVVVDVSQDWAYACRLQQSFMGPRWSAGSVDYAARCRQVRELGGDCHDFIPLADQQQALVMGDASGKGVAGALMMASVQSSLRTASLFTGDDLAALFRIVNLQAHASSPAERYATVFYGVFDASAGTLRYVNAGHNPPLVLRCDGSVEWLELGEAPIGMFPDARYCERFAQLNPGDLVILYTDGVTEATDQTGAEWGVDGLLNAATSHRPQSADDLVQLIFDALDDFSRGSLADDATVAVLRVP